ncbi:MAG: DNA-3-methyladenine glycosylase [Candidatus Campbellbacteria bacterium]|nr:DNA-3-methyladenine glycosylase [Candidatus Campbellbacteria bacterium]
MSVKKKDTEKYKEFFIESDSTMKRLALKNGMPLWRVDDNYFRSLVESIIGQQVSVKAAQTINERFLALFGGEHFPTPEKVNSITEKEMYKAGVSPQKASYIKGLAEAFTENTIEFEKFEEMNDEEIIRTLTRVRGIGRWTVEMFLIFSLGREDVFSFADKGLLQAMQENYGKKKQIKTDDLERIVKKWKPYRSIASLLLWESVD